ncbi:MAG: N-ethylammeline chlorohydrolase, partial [Arthrobacter sp.]
MRTRFSAEFVLGHVAGQHVLIRNGDVVYEDSRIVYVGRGYDGTVDESFDLGRSLITPGLIDLDALTDIDHLLIDSWASPDRATSLQWSEDYFRSRRADVFTAEERQTIR